MHIVSTSPVADTTNETLSWARGVLQRLKDLLREDFPTDVESYEQTEEYLAQLAEACESDLGDPADISDPTLRQTAETISSLFQQCYDWQVTATKSAQLVQAATNDLLSSSKSYAPAADDLEMCYYTLRYNPFSTAASIVVGTYAIKRSSYEKLVLHGPRWLYRVLRENTHCDARLLPCDPPDEDVMEAAYALWTPHDKESPYCSLGEAISATHEILGYRTAAM